MEVEATNPPKSPTTPPPNATNNDRRSAPNSRSSEATCPTMVRLLDLSPEGTRMGGSPTQPASHNNLLPHLSHRMGSVSTKTDEYPFMRCSARHTPRPITTAYSPALDFTCSRRISLPRSCPALAPSYKYHGAPRPATAETTKQSCEALECGSLLPLSSPRTCSRNFNRRHDSPPASWLVLKRQQAAALQSFAPSAHRVTVFRSLSRHVGTGGAPHSKASHHPRRCKIRAIRW